MFSESPRMQFNFEKDLNDELKPNITLKQFQPKFKDYLNESLKNFQFNTSALLVQKKNESEVKKLTYSKNNSPYHKWAKKLLISKSFDFKEFTKIHLVYNKDYDLAKIDCKIKIEKFHLITSQKVLDLKVYNSVKLFIRKEPQNSKNAVHRVQDRQRD